MVIGGRQFDTGSRCHIAGILNLTPDSFSDGGKWDAPEKAVRRADEMIREGADLIDVGGESTRPGFTPVTDGEEIGRTAPVIEALRSRFDVPLSIDTYKSAVAAAAIAAGADMVNDVRGFKHGPGMAKVVAEAGVACCLMHGRADAVFRNFMPDLLDDLRESASIAEKVGVARDRIMLDPGIGFGKTYEMNLIAIDSIDLILELGYPVMLGVSRKSVIGTALGLPVGERVEGSIAAAVVGVLRGCSFLRVHDVKETRRAVTMAETIINSGRISAPMEANRRGAGCDGQH